MEQRLSALIRAFLRAGKASTHAPYFVASQHAQDALRDAIAALLEQGRNIGTQHAQDMTGKQERSVFNGLKDIIARAKDIVDGIMDHVRDVIDEALSNTEDTEEVYSQSEIVEMTMNELIDELPELVAGDEITTAVEGAVYDEMTRLGVPQMRSVSEDDDRVCERCQANADEGPINIGDSFATGDSVPPYHRKCRCNVVPA